MYDDKLSGSYKARYFLPGTNMMLIRCSRVCFRVISRSSICTGQLLLVFTLSLHILYTQCLLNVSEIKSMTIDPTSSDDIGLRTVVDVTGHSEAWMYY